MLIKMEGDKEKVEDFQQTASDETIGKEAVNVQISSPLPLSQTVHHKANVAVSNETAVSTKIGALENQSGKEKTKDFENEASDSVNTIDPQTSLHKELSPNTDVSTIKLQSVSTKTKSPDEVSFMKSMQVKKNVNKVDSSKVKIQPVYGHATINRMLKLKGPFPVVYIGAPNISDSKANKPVQLETKKLNENDDNRVMAKCKEDASDKSNYSGTFQNADCSSTKVEENVREFPRNNFPSININPQHDIPLIEATVGSTAMKDESYDIQKVMDGFMQDTSISSANPNLKNSLLKSDNFEAVPSVVVSGTKAFEKKSYPLPTVRSPFSHGADVPMLMPSIASCNSRSSNRGKEIRKGFPTYSVLKSTPVTKTNSPVICSDIHKLKYHIDMNGLSTQPKVLPTLPRLAGGSIVSTVKVTKPVPVTSNVFANVITPSPIVCKSIPFSPTFTANNLKRKIACSVSETDPKVARTDLVFKGKNAIPVTIMQTASVKPSASINTAKTTSTNVAQNLIPVRLATDYQNAVVKSTHVTQSSKSKQLPSSTSRTSKIEPLLPPLSLKRPGILVKFEDNVQLWIDKLRDLMYLDDEPVLSWKIEKGTEVAARYTDGLFYDAIVLAAYDGPVKRDKLKKNKVVDTKNITTTDPTSGYKPTNLEQTPVRKSPIENPSSKVASVKTPSTPETEGEVEIKDVPKTSATKHEEKSPRPSLLRVHIKKLDMREGGRNSWGAKLVDSKTPCSPSSDQSNQEKKASIHVKCSNCFVVCQNVSLFRKHQKTVCGSKGIVVTGFQFEPNVLAQVDENKSPPLVEGFRRNVETSNGLRSIPRNSEWKRCFRRGTHFLHRWQTEKGRKWYNGKILRLLESKKGMKSEFEVKYMDDENDTGPIRICLYEDYPHDIRIVTR